MPINSGIVEETISAGSGSLDVQVSYDATKGVNAQTGAIDPTKQPIVNNLNGGRDACVVTNTTGAAQTVILTGPTGTVLGEPTVPTGTTVLTAAQLASVGITTRDNLSLSISLA